MFNFLLLALAVSAISLTLSRASLFRPLRMYLLKTVPFFGKLLSCPYCLSHWFAIGAALGYAELGAFSQLILAFALVGMSAILSGVIMKLLLDTAQENEIDALVEEVTKRGADT